MKDVSEELIDERIKDLRENTDFVSTLFESLIGYAIIAADFDGNVIAYNEGARHIYGYAPQEIIGKQNIELFFPKDFIESGGLEQKIADLIEDERSSYEGEMIRKNGERFPAQILFTLTNDHSGKVVGFIKIVGDLTERVRAEAAEAQAQANVVRVEQLERELRSLEGLSGTPKTAVTAQLFGLVALRQSVPNTFNELVQRYGDLMDLALEQRAYKVEHNMSEELRAIGEQIGSLKAGPRDVVEIHSTALKTKIREVNRMKAAAYVEEGRLMVLELMGDLASFYRNYSRGVRKITGAGTHKINQ